MHEWNIFAGWIEMLLCAVLGMAFGSVHPPAPLPREAPALVPMAGQADNARRVKERK